MGLISKMEEDFRFCMYCERVFIEQQDGPVYFANMPERSKISHGYCSFYCMFNNTYLFEDGEKLLQLLQMLWENHQKKLKTQSLETFIKSK